MSVETLDAFPELNDVNGEINEAMADQAPTLAQVDNSGDLLYPAVEFADKADWGGVARLLATSAMASVTFRSWQSPDGNLRVHPTNEAGVLAFKELQLREEARREEADLLKLQRDMDEQLGRVKPDGQTRPFTEDQSHEWDRWEDRERRINQHLFTLVNSNGLTMPQAQRKAERANLRTA